MQVRQLPRFIPAWLVNHTNPWLLPALLACYLIWGSTFYAVQVALHSFPPFFQMGTRFLAASAILFAWALWRRSRWPTLQQWIHAAIAGTLMLGGGMGLLACAEQYIHSSLAAAMTTLEPLLICLLSITLGWRATRRELLGIGIGIFGVILLSCQGSLQAQPMGLVYMLGSVVCWSVGSVLLARYLHPATGAIGLASQMLCGAIVLLILSHFRAETPQIPTQSAWLAWGYLVLAGSLGAYCAYMYLIKNASPAVYTSYNYVIPVIALAIGVIWGHEQVQAVEMLAMGICLSGIVLLLSPKPHK